MHPAFSYLQCLSQHLRLQPNRCAVYATLRDSNLIDQNPTWSQLNKLIKFRHQIIHTKADKLDTPNFYKRLFSNALKFDCEKILQILQDFIACYDPDLIEEFPCGKQERFDSHKSAPTWNYLFAYSWPHSTSSGSISFPR